MTSGGMLRGIAKRHNLPLLLMDVPGPPRTTFPFQFAALTGIFSRLGMLPVQSAEIETTADFLSRRVQSWDVSMPVDSNHAKLLAIKLRGKIPVIYGAGLLSPVARRWKTQFNENSKTWAFAESFPELVHNASVGFDFPIISLRRVFVCMLRSSSMHRRALVQYKAITNLLDERSFPHEIIDAKGETAIEQVLETALLGDFTSYYLAILNRTDPTSNPAIDFVKKYMADTRG
jgi:glucose/mannose-6-phosphate isomerase